MQHRSGQSPAIGRRTVSRTAFRFRALALKLIAEARELAGASLWLFPSPNGERSIDAHAPTRALARARDAIGLNDFRIHDLRRTAATQMAELGVSPHTISMILNHVSARQGTITSKVYVQYSYDREKRDALEAWSARIEAIISAERRRVNGNINSKY